MKYVDRTSVTVLNPKRRSADALTGIVTIGAPVHTLSFRWAKALRASLETKISGSSPMTNASIASGNIHRSTFRKFNDPSD